MNHVNSIIYMKKEHADSRSRVNQLHNFIFDEASNFSELQKHKQVELISQLAHMKSVIAILEARIWAHDGE